MQLKMILWNTDIYRHVLTLMSTKTPPFFLKLQLQRVFIRHLRRGSLAQHHQRWAAQPSRQPQPPTPGQQPFVAGESAHRTADSALGPAARWIVCGESQKANIGESF